MDIARYTFSSCVKSLRAHMQLSQEGFATCEVSSRTVSRWENQEETPTRGAVLGIWRAVCAYGLEESDPAQWLRTAHPELLRQPPRQPPATESVPRVALRLPGTSTDVVFHVRTPEDLEFLTLALRSYL